MPDDLADNSRFPPYPVGFLSAVSYPSEQRLSLALRRRPDLIGAALGQAAQRPQVPSPLHQIGGYPNPIQNDRMEEDCQAIAAMLGPPDQALTKVDDWRLLLQLETDNDAGMLWATWARCTSGP